MKIALAIYSSLIYLSYAFITHDEGSLRAWLSMSGWRGWQFTQQITFKSSFRNVPQVSLTPWIMDFETASPYGFSLTISAITTTYFNLSMTLNCNAAYNMAFLWIAIDDVRFEIINQFNVSNPQSTTLSHNNKNALSGFIVTMSFVGTAGMAYTLDIQNITETTLKVVITQTNVLELGYSIILGPASAFNTSASLTNTPSSTTYYSPLIDITWDQFYFIFTKQFSFDPSTGGLMRFRLQPLMTNNDLTWQYQYETWGGTNFIKWERQLSIITFGNSSQNVMKSKVRIAKIENTNLTNTIQFWIPELNLNYENSVQEYFESPSSITTFNMNFRIVCNPNQTVVAQFLQYNNNQSKYISKTCFPRQNQIVFYLISIQSRLEYQYFNISITSNQLLITQTLYNQQTLIKPVIQIDIQQQ